MKVLIVYYSYTGHTEEAAHCLCKFLEKEGNAARELPLQVKSQSSLVIKAFKAVSSGLLPIEHDPVNTEDYDVLFLGTPVWGCCPSPAVNAFIDELSRCQGLVAVPFVTSGGHGSNSTLARMSRRLEEKGCTVKQGFAMKGKDELTCEDKKGINDWLDNLKLGNLVENK